MAPVKNTQKRKKGINHKLITPTRSKKRRATLSTGGSGSKSKGASRVSRFAYRIGLLALLFLFLYTLVNFAQLVNVYKGLKIDDAVLLSSNVRLNEIGETRRTLYVFENLNEAGQREISDVYLFAYDPENVDLLVLHIPGWVYAKPSYGELTDELSVANLKYAGSLINEDRAYEYSLWELENLTAVSVDSYVWVEAEAKVLWEEQLVGNRLSSESGSQYINSLFRATALSNLTFKNDLLLDLASGLKSNLDAIEIYRDMRVYSELISQEDASIVEVGNEEMLLLEPSTDGNDRYFYNYNAVDSAIASSIDAVRGREVEKEQTRCEVYNGSSISGLASLYSRKVENNGLRVVRLDNSPVEYQETTIYVSNRERFNDSLDLIIKVLPLNPKVVEGRPDFLTTGDIVIVLGEDYEKVYEW